MVPMPPENLKQQLTILYQDHSKHSQYQNIPEFVKETIGYSEPINEEWRGDTARYQCIVAAIEKLTPSSICDVGANTGFFSLSLAQRFPEIAVTAFEGNPNHVEFMKLIKEAFSLGNIEIKNYYIDDEGIGELGQYDMMLHLNVLHHAGVDFDKEKATYTNLQNYLITYLKKVRQNAKTMVFQMGYNWGGNKQKPIVELQDDYGKLRYSADVFAKAGWEIQAIAHVIKDGSLAYKNYPSQFSQVISHGGQNEALLEYIRSQQLQCFSEFYRRPIFLLNS
jgi:hypothetical protein